MEAWMGGFSLSFALVCYSQMTSYLENDIASIEKAYKIPIAFQSLLRIVFITQLALFVSSLWCASATNGNPDSQTSGYLTVAECM